MMNEETIFDRQLRPIVEREILSRPAEARHTKEPWPVFTDIAVMMTPDPEGTPVAVISWDDYIRARACVNACAGIDTERLTHGVVLENAQRVALERWDFKAQRDELLAALREVSISAREGVTKMTPELLSFIDAAIAKVKP